MLACCFVDGCERDEEVSLTEREEGADEAQDVLPTVNPANARRLGTFLLPVSRVSVELSIHMYVHVCCAHLSSTTYRHRHRQPSSKVILVGPLLLASAMLSSARLPHVLHLIYFACHPSHLQVVTVVARHIQDYQQMRPSRHLQPSISAIRINKRRNSLKPTAHPINGHVHVHSP